MDSRCLRTGYSARAGEWMAGGFCGAVRLSQAQAGHGTHQPTGDALVIFPSGPALFSGYDTRAGAGSNDSMLGARYKGSRYRCCPIARRGT